MTGGIVVAAGLLVAAVWLWTHNLIVFAAPVGFAAAGAAWVGVDNAIIYPRQRARALPDTGSAPARPDDRVTVIDPPSPS